MFKKFALLAGMAAFVVACGPSQAEIEAKAKAVADSIAAVLRADSIRMAEEAAAAAAAAEAKAAAIADSIAAAEAAAAEAMKGKKK
ncbi:MAG: hypothetical protein IPJ85_11100 [Flavobacteriales bacterium]|nr:hypothetical protein [Flavobacteriales bacterium]